MFIDPDMLSDNDDEELVAVMEALKTANGKGRRAVDSSNEIGSQARAQGVVEEHIQSVEATTITAEKV